MPRQHGPTARSPLTVTISRLGRRPGATFSVRETVPSPSRIGLDLIAIEPGSPLELDLRVESVSEGVLVTGTLDAPTAGECARCLTPIIGRVQVGLTELFAYPDSALADSALADSATDADELGRVVDDVVDLEQPIIDAVGLELPFAPVCRADCPGLCLDCGVALAAAEPGHRHDHIDPRWARLAGMVPPQPGSPT
ncbi:DUF177 domain-containing protein [Mycobacterium sp.]|uniref:YceD family protein n=1 Tax=Mycobacterium sp. TaxID=1785 RepID=UPI0031D6A767